METKRGGFIHKLFMLLMTAFFGSITVLSLIDIFTINDETWLITLILTAGALVLYCLFAHMLLKMRSEKSFLAILIILSLGIRLVWVLMSKTVLQSDFEMMYESALQASQGDFSFNADPYYTTWAYQMGFTLYQALVLKLAGPGTLVLKLLNCIFSTGTVLLVYKTGSRLLNEKAGRLAAFLFSVYPTSFMMDSVLSNQQLSEFLFYLGFYLLLRRERPGWAACLIAGVLFALAQAIRPLAMVVLVCFVLYQLLRRLVTREKGLLCGTALTLGAYFAVITLIGQLLIVSGVSPYGLKNRDSLWKFVTGSNYATTGQYSDDDAQFISQFPVGEERTQAELELIRERVSDPARAAKLMLKKFSAFWGTRDDLYWSIEQGQLLHYSELIEQSLYALAMLAASLGSIALYKKKNLRLGFFVLLSGGYAGAHLLIEIQARYRDFLLPVVFLFAGYGLFWLHNKLSPERPR